LPVQHLAQLLKLSLQLQLRCSEAVEWLQLRQQIPNWRIWFQINAQI
jgi:hypothetical protein